MAKRKTRGVNLPVPQTREQAETAIAAIGADQRELERITTDMNAELARVKQAAEAKAAPIRERLEAAVEGLKIFAEANREALCGRAKSAKLGAGRIGWRNRPASVNVRGTEKIIETLLASTALQKFLRTKHEINKEAMLADPKLAGSIAGVSIASPGEDFFVDPFGAELSDVAASVGEAA